MTVAPKDHKRGLISPFKQSTDIQLEHVQLNRKGDPEIRLVATTEPIAKYSSRTAEEWLAYWKEQFDAGKPFHQLNFEFFRMWIGQTDSAGGGGKITREMLLPRPTS